MKRFLLTILVLLIGNIGCQAKISTKSKSPAEETPEEEPEVEEEEEEEETSEDPIDFNFEDDDVSEFSFDATSIGFSSGVAALLPVDQSHSENTVLELGNVKGYRNLIWNTDYLTINFDPFGPGDPLPNDFYYGVDATNLEALFHFDDPWLEHNDVVYDDIGNHGYFQSDQVSTNKSGLGKHGRALALDGTGDYVNLGDVHDLTGNLTVAVWVKPTNMSIGMIVAKFNQGVAGKFYVGMTGAGVIEFSDGTNDLFSDSSLTLNKWAHVVVSWDGSTRSIYINGKLDKTDSGAFSVTDTGADFLIGSRQVGGAPQYEFEGFIDELAIFSRALDTTEIESLYSNQINSFVHEHWPNAPGIMDGNVLLLHMDETSGDLVDYSGLGNNGTPGETPAYGLPAQSGTAVSFADDGYFDFGDPIDFTGTNNFSVCLWIRSTADGVAISLLDTNTASLGWEIRVQGGPDRIEFRRQGVTSTFTVALTNIWTHICGTYNGANQILYVNGREADSDANANPLTHSETLLVGGNYFMGNPSSTFDGRIDEVAIWNRALSGAEIQMIFDRQYFGGELNVHELPNAGDMTSSAWFDMSDNVLLMHLNKFSVIDSGPDPDIFDYSRYGFHGSFSADDSGDKVAPGRFLRGLHFDGNSDGVFVSDQDEFSPFVNDITVMAWAKVPVAADNGGVGCNSGQGALVAKNLVTGDQREWMMQLGNGTFCITAQTGTNGTHLQASYAMDPRDNLLRHYTAVIQANDKARIYLDGVKVGEDLTSSAAMINGTAVVSIGRTQSGSPFEGVIDEVAIFNRVLTDAEIAKIYDYQSGRYSGTLTSTPIDTGSATAQWSSLGWQTNRPFGKALLGNEDSELSSAYADLPNDTLMNGNVLLLHFDETSINSAPGGEDWADSSPSGIHLDMNSATVADHYARLGRFNYALKLDGTFSNEGGELAPELDLPNFSFSVWLKSDNNGVNHWVFLKASSGQGYGLRVAGSSYLFYCQNAGWQSLNSGGGDVKYNQWQHVAGTFNGSIARIYVDGSEANNGACTLTLPVGQDFLIGASPEHYSGLIDEFAIWDRELTPDEVTELFRRGASRIQFKFRTCDASGCDDEPWYSPDNDATPYSSYHEFFSELHNNTTGSANLDLTDTGMFPDLSSTDNQFFQYKVYLDNFESLYPRLYQLDIGPTHYNGSNPTIITVNPISFSKLNSFTATSSVGTVKFQLSNDGGTTWYWYNGGWTTASSVYAESNSDTEIDSNIGTFPVGSGSLKVKAFFHSANAAEATNLEDLVIDYDP